jgi:D-lactate dehydrogenase
MDVAVYSTKTYDRQFLDQANVGVHGLSFFETRLSLETAALAAGHQAVCVFVNDKIGAEVLEKLASLGVRLVTLRCAGFNNVDLRAAAEFGVTVARVPAYSPAAVAEHTVALMLTLNRKTHRAYNRVREGNFALDGLLGFDLCGKTVGIVGTGKIGTALARILRGFGCRLLATDPFPDAECLELGVEYVSWSEMCSTARIISLHCPLTPETHQLVDAAALRRMQPGVMLVNTSRGAVIDTRAVIEALKEGRLGSLALDVYEEEADLFFEDLSDRVITDDVFARLLTFPNVLITGHQAFLTEEALTAIADVTIANVTAFERTGRPLHELSMEQIASG